MNPTLIGIGLYIIAQLAIGFIVSRRIRSDTDYILAGRSFGYGLATFSIFATWFGAETCVGSAGAIYEKGLSACSRDPMGYTICLLLMGLIFALPFRRRGFATLGDLFRQRYSPTVERVAVLIMVPSSIIWAGAQIHAFGNVLAGASAMNRDIGITIAAIVVLTYTIAGGILADAITDIVQGVVLIIGLLIVFFAVITSIGGFGPAIEAIDPARLSLRAPGASVLDTMETWAVPICGSIVAQEIISRILACRTPRIAFRSSMMATGMYLSVGVIPLFLGLIGPHVLPGVEDSEHFLQNLAKIHTSTFIYILFCGAVVSAILSTVDSCLLAAGTLVAENLILSVRPQTSPTAKLRMCRLCVAAFGFVAYGIALSSDSAVELVEDASAFGSSGILIVVCFGLFTRIGGPGAALAGLVTGITVWSMGTYVVPPLLELWPNTAMTELLTTYVSAPYLCSLAAALAAYLLVEMVRKVVGDPAPIDCAVIGASEPSV